MLRVGVDVGGTFTKAVAVDLATLEIVASSVVSTTHGEHGGVAAGVVQAVAQIAAEVGADRIELVTHSTTQAVNALLEGDAGLVGVIGMGRRPDLARVEKRTRLNHVELSAGKRLRVRYRFFDVTDGLPRDAIREALEEFRSAGVSAVCVAEAFSPDDTTNETAVSALASDAGFPVCASTDLSGLYGLELRTVTAALNASILPIAVSTASYVDTGVRVAGIAAPVMVMRSDGGATDLEGFSAAPVRTLYSGPAASVAGALRYTGVKDAIVIEVGGTSTNVAAIHNGHPALSYVRVASHATALRSVDVRVVGVAGGSMLRARRNRVYGVGPRSAHIAGLEYSCYLDPQLLGGAEVEIRPALPGDPDDYVVLRTSTGVSAALTTTCAANALEWTQSGDYCFAPATAAVAAFATVGRRFGVDGQVIARQMLAAASDAVCELSLTVAKSSKLTDPSIVGVGGGAGALTRHVAARLGWPIVIPEHAEVISSIGDALSLIRAERERTVPQLDATTLNAMMAEVEAEVIAAGASPASIEVRVEEVAERSTVRAIATGAVGLSAGALPGRHELSLDSITADAAGAHVQAIGAYFVVDAEKAIIVRDRYGEDVIAIDGERAAAGSLVETIDRLTRYRGPVTLRPTVWIIDGSRLIELSAAGANMAAYSGRDDVTYLVGRQRS